jgi:mercuric ion binding protein
MMNMKNLMIALLTLVSLNSAFSQEKKQKYETVIIQTSAECGDCKKRIEDGLNYTKGVSFAELDLDTKKVTVKFNTTKTTLDEVCNKINSIGYDADESKAEPEAQKRLPTCCHPGGMKQ